MTSPDGNESQPLLNNRVRREQVAVHVPVNDSEESIGQFRIFSSLLVDSIPGSYISLLSQLRNLFSYSYSIIFTAKFDSSHHNSDSSETRPGRVIHSVSSFDACLCNWRVAQLIFLLSSNEIP